MISMERLYTQLAVVCIIILLSFIILISMIVISGLYFVSSIVQPLGEVNKITKKIAGGDLSVRIENNDREDEVGELCDAINNMAIQLGETERIKAEFISMVSHEIRTPLTAIKGWGETLKQTSENRELTQRGLDVILGETERLSVMVEEMLDFSKIQKDGIKISVSEIELCSIIKNVYEIYKQKAQQDEICLSISLPSEEIYIIGDENKISQVFINIIDNAIKYSSKGQSVDIAVEKSEKYAKIIFKDTGCGISSRDLEHVKEKFYKANTNVRGAGIGLAVADEIIKNTAEIL